METIRNKVCFKVSGAISSNMVFQRDRGNPCLGKRKHGEYKIFGRIYGEKRNSRITEESGKWMFRNFSAHAKT